MTAVIDVKNVTKIFKSDWTFKPKVSVDDVSFSVHQGECFGFVGPNGAGKTTSIKMLLDIIRPTKGTVRLFGLPPSDPSARARVGFLPERPYFYEYLTAHEMLVLYARLSRVASASTEKRIAEMLDLVGLGEAQHVPLRRYSKGMLQRAGLAQALIGNPELVILDEPMSGLDPIGRRQVRDLILRERKAGKTVFFSSHILSDVEAICDRVAIIDQGRVVLVGDVAELVAHSAKNESDVILKGAGKLPQSVAHFAPRPGGQHEGTLANAVLQDALRDAMSAGFSVVSVAPKRGSLEDEFLAGIAKNAAANGSSGVPR